MAGEGSTVDDTDRLSKSAEREGARGGPAATLLPGVTGEGCTANELAGGEAELAAGSAASCPTGREECEGRGEGEGGP